MRPGRTTLAAPLLLAGLLAGAGCSGGGADGGPAGLPSSDPVATVGAAQDGTTTVRLVATDRLTLEPGAVVVAPGPVVVQVRNTGAMPHEVSLVEPATGRTLATGGVLHPGTEVRLAATLSMPGDYEIRCGFHPGMTAALTVR